MNGLGYVPRMAGCQGPHGISLRLVVSLLGPPSLPNHHRLGRVCSRTSFLTVLEARAGEGSSGASLCGLQMATFLPPLRTAASSHVQPSCHVLFFEDTSHRGFASWKLSISAKACLQVESRREVLGPGPNISIWGRSSAIIGRCEPIELLFLRGKLGHRKLWILESRV